MVNTNTSEKLGKEESIDALRERAVHEAVKPEAKSNGDSPLNVPKWVRDASNGLRKRSTEAHPEISDVADSVLGRVRGISAEILCKYSVTESPICFENVEGLDVSEERILDPAEFTGRRKFRKDVALVKHYCITNEIPDTLKDILIDSMDNEYSRVGVRKSVFSKLRALQNGDYDLDTKAGRSEINRFIDTAFNYAYQKNSPLSLEAEKSLYDSTTIPDQLIVNKDGKTTGAVEVKGYTPEEFGEYVKELENQFKDWKNASPLLRPSRFNLQIEMPYINGPNWEKNITEGMKMGVNIDGIRKLTQIINGDPMEIDLVNAETAQIEKSSPAYIVDYPVIIALPSDIPQEYIDRLGNIINEAGIKNIQIREIPFSSTDIDMYSRANLVRYYSDPNTVKRLGIKTYEEMVGKDSKGRYQKQDGKLIEEFYSYIKETS